MKPCKLVLEKDKWRAGTPLLRHTRELVLGHIHDSITDPVGDVTDEVSWKCRIALEEEGLA